MALSAFEYIQKLYELELYESVVEQGGLFITVAERCAEFVTPLNKQQLLVYYGHALFQTEQYRKAEQVYMKALHMRRAHVFSDPEERRLAKLSMSECDLKFQLYLCNLKQRHYSEALGFLESIPVASRTAKMCYALASLYKQLGMVKEAANSYNDVLERCPFAFDALINLMQLGKSDEHLGSCRAAQATFAALPCLDWFPTWVEGNCALASRQYSVATCHFRTLDTSSNLTNNVNVLLALAKAYYGSGEYSNAVNVLLRAHSLDCHALAGMDVLAYLLFEEKRFKELESLAGKLIDLAALPDGCTLTPEPWIAMGYVSRARKKIPKALYFGQKACTAGIRPSAEALLLKGRLLVDSRKLTEAAQHFHEAAQVAPFQHEVHHAIVETMLARHLTDQAKVFAVTSVKQLDKSPRSLALLASVYARDPTTVGRAQNLLEQALSMAPNLNSAVHDLLEIYDRQKAYDKAIRLLRDQTSLNPKSKLHKLLGDFLMKAKNAPEALDRYRVALSLDPTDSELRQTMSDMEDDLRVHANSSPVLLPRSILNSPLLQYVEEHVL